MYNRYAVRKEDENDETRNEYQEIMTMPTITGDLKIKNKHAGVNFDDRDMPRKYLPKEKLTQRTLNGPQKATLESLAVKIHDKSIRYNKEYYETVERADKRAIDTDLIEDPRTLDEIEQENLDLKT